MKATAALSQFFPRFGCAFIGSLTPFDEFIHDGFGTFDGAHKPSTHGERPSCLWPIAVQSQQLMPCRFDLSHPTAEFLLIRHRFHADIFTFEKFTLLSCPLM